MQNRDELITINLNTKSIIGDKLRGLVEFCFKISNKVSICQMGNNGMTLVEAKKARSKYNNSLKAMDLPTLSDEINTSNKPFISSDNGVKAYVKENLSEYKLMKRIVTCTTACTYGPVRVMYYLELEDNIMNTFKMMKDIYEAVIHNPEKDFLLEDPVFYNDKQYVLIICSSEKYGTLFLTETQYNEFKKMGIEHRTGYDFNSAY
ncbi:MAG: hypothetical protein GX915_05225 [Clostridiales bacterium]|nr:hypothetical protein [Clostridiales bacterium]